MAVLESVITFIPSTCPLPNLKQAIDAWKTYKLSGKELEEASKISSLDILLEFRARPLPTPTRSVQDFRGLSRLDRLKWKPDDFKKHYDDNKDFYDAESRVISANNSNRKWLSDLLEWVKEKKMTPIAIQKIKEVLFTHQDGELG